MEQKRRLKEEDVRTSYTTPKEWNEKYHEADVVKKCAQHWKERHEALEKESLSWVNEKKHLNGLLDTYVKSINILNISIVMYRVKFDGLVKLCNELVREIP